MIIQQNIPLRDKNWFHTGGPAEFYCEPHNAQEFQQAIIWAQANTQNITLLGEGANVLISDEGCSGLIIRPQNNIIDHKKIVHENNNATLVTAGAGVLFPELIDYCLKHH